MALYSYSKLSTFEQCAFKYKLRYIEKIKPEIEPIIEIHLGKCAHDSLEWIYNQVKESKIPTAEELIQHYSKNWQDNYNSKFVITDKKLAQKDYFNKGVGFLLNYYMEHKPFDDNTLETEKKILFSLGNSQILGYIDRLAYDEKKNEYVIHDYKTSGSLPTKERIDNDRQLSIYSLAIQELFGKQQRSLLVWHYLNFNKQIFARKSNQELEQLKQDILELIQKIESAKQFPTTKSPLCNWCEYKNMCPTFGGQPQIKKQRQETLDKYPTVKKYLRD
ncbi:MAG: PD-(D/E)XK nuclease family protein [Nanoarchaeota archaeon]|nr:PD-(D/E)XK nuclease family protein [Nanoarchaeota archaeon]